VRLFGEEPNATQLDEFFSTFEQFLVALSDARMDNENNRKKREEDEKRAKQEAEVSTQFQMFLLRQENLELKIQSRPKFGILNL